MNPTSVAMPTNTLLKVTNHRSLLLMLCLFLSVNLTAQMAKDKLPKNGSISGKVIDAKTEEPVPYATIVVKDLEGKTITGGIT